MDLTVGAIIEGKVKSITNFGAFIALPENKTGMVHISEVANVYVSDIRQHLTEGQDVKVMVIAIDPAGKINLSMKRLEPKPAPSPRQRTGGDHRGGGKPATDQRSHGRPSQSQQPQTPKSSEEAFEDLLKQFMSESDSKISSMRQYSEPKPRPRRR